MKENKKVMPSLGACGRNGAATGRKFLRLALCFLALFMVLLPAKADINWASLGEAPAANGSYYLYNTSANRFLIYNGASSNAGVTGTNSPASVDGKPFTFDGNGRVVIRQSNTNRTCNAVLNNQQYRLQDNSDTRYYLYLSGSTLSRSRNSLSSTNYSNWIFIPEATYNAQKKTLYYAATVEANNGGTVQADFVNPVVNDAATATGNYAGFDASKQVTAYFKATPNSGYLFAGWKLSPADADYVSIESAYSKQFTATSEDENWPTTLTVYAYFEKESAVDAQILNDGGEVLANEDGDPYIGSFADMVSALGETGGGVILQLLRNVTMTESVSIGHAVTLDLNGNVLSVSAGSSLIIQNTADVRLVDNSSAKTGAISLSGNAASPLVAVQVAGSLKLDGGKITVSNTSTDAAAKAIGVQISGSLQMNSGSIDITAGINALGVEIQTGGSAAMIGGTINATAASNAIGVLANGNASLSDNIKVTAETTTGSNAYGIQVANSGANVTLNGHTVSAIAKTTNAYALYATAGNVTTGGALILKANAKGTATTAYAAKQEGTATINVQTGRFWTNNTAQDITGVNKTYLQLWGGYYVNQGALDTYKQDGVDKAELQNNNKFKTEGYNYVLSNGDNPNYVAFATSDNKYFGSLEDALTYANTYASVNPSTTLTIRQIVPEYSMETPGTYTLPANAVLLIPYVGSQTTMKGTSVEFTNAETDNTFFRKLTLGAGVHINVVGKIEAAAAIWATTYNASKGTGKPAGQYGQIHMNAGSSLTLNSGAILYAWGYVTGSGTIDALKGSKTYECFQINDWPGGSNALDLNDNDKKVFIANQYAIQNIEVATTYKPGAKAYAATGFYFSTKQLGSTITGYAKQTNIQLVGVPNESALFLLDEADEAKGAWVCKAYDTAHDRQKYIINSSASLGSISIELVIRDATGTGFLGGLAAAYVNGKNVTMNSANYILPLTCNMSIELQNGDMEITQSVSMLPGSEITMDKQSRVILDEGESLYLYDLDNWGNYAFSGQKTRYTYYSPTWGTDNPRKSIALVDAKMDVSGTLDIAGDENGTSGLFTTAAGANICSTNEAAGTIIFRYAAPTAESYTDKLYQTTSNTAAIVNIPVKPAKLKNNKPAPNDYVSSRSAAEESSYCYKDNEWVNLVNAGCIVIDMTDAQNPKYFAKPAEYVEVTAATADPTTHMYYEKTDAANPKTYILIEDVDNSTCQWWEVEYDEEIELYHCLHRENDVYYYWTGSAWAVKTCRVTWVTKPYDQNDKGLVYYDVNYATIPTYNGDKPSRPISIDSTYNFEGWTPDLEAVTKDVTYTAVFSSKARQYLVTFQDADGSTLENKYWDYGSTPSPYNAPTPEGKILSWKNITLSTAQGVDVYGISSVTGDVTYRATYTDIPKTTFTIVFQNHDGSVLQIKECELGTLPVYDKDDNHDDIIDVPTKVDPTDQTSTYEWTGGWTPEIVAATEDAVYTAEFRKVAAMFTITFVKENGSVENPEDIIETQQLEYGHEKPVCSNPPTKEPTATDIANGISYYEVIWTPTISTVTGNAVYTVAGFMAYKTELQVNVTAGEHGSVSVTKEEEIQSLPQTYEWGTELVLTATADAANGYEFARWSDGNTDNPRTITVTSPINLTAIFALKQYTITWKNDASTVLGTTKVNHGEIPTHSTPVKDRTAQYTYVFTGWSPAPYEANGDETYTAQYSANLNSYTITYVLNNGLSDIQRTEEYGATPNAPTPAKSGKNGIRYIFAGWMDSDDNMYEYDADLATYTPSLPTIVGNASYYAQFIVKVEDLRAGLSEDANAKDLIISEEGSEATNLIIEPTGTVNISGSVAVSNFIIESNGTQSGQLLGTSSTRLTINEHAYFDLTLNAQRRTWYAVAVPWAVDAENGISIKGGRHLVLGSDFDLVYYQGDVRASEGAGYQCWKYAEDGDGDKIMHPGRLYMMYFGSEIETIRFENYDDTPFNDAVTTVSQYSASESDDANWNGIANPMAYHATMSAGGATYGYYLNNGRVDEYMVGEGEPTYKLVNLASYNAIVGKPLFIQAVNTNSITTTPKIAAAPRRIREIEIEEGIETVYEITFGAEGSDNKDNIFIQTVETKEEGYVIGQDLLKAGMSAKLPQLWINQYGKKLSVNTATPMNGVHEYPLTLNIPQAGDYTIAIESTQGDTESLYLIKDGNVIWNLSNGEYTGTFEKGTDASYSLRTAAKSPQTATGIDEALIEAQGEIQKVIINDHVYIIRGEQVYTIDGQLVK